MQAISAADTVILAEACTRGSTMKRTMVTLEGRVLSRDEFAGRIGLTPEELEAQFLLCLDIDGERVYPAFQIAGAGLLPGMGTVVEAFAIKEPWMRVNFMLTGDARLDGQRPIDALRQGRIVEVIQAARAYGEHGAA
ncbi:Rv2175c family DNA-binding protein [Corticibacterium sp. UT-5YL-CI-8]|nr:Rv2175c family DNA-binding protein [Tianweitania sp. UT-5YL-CI-8]